MADNPIEKGKGDSRNSQRLILITAIVLGVYVLYVVVMILLAYSRWVSPQNLGTFGDSFGAINALFSGGALIGVVIALYLQMRDLRESVENQGKQLHYTAQAQHLKTAKELVLLGLRNPDLRAWMADDQWKPQDRYIQLSVNHYFLAWQAHVLELFTDEYWDSTAAEIKELFGDDVFSEWWESHKTPYYPREFVKAIDDLIRDNNAASQCS